MDRVDNQQIKKYLKVLKKYNKQTSYYDIAINMIKEKCKTSTVELTSICVTSPVLISYVIWILDEAKRMGIKRLYFLARDGNILYKIAKILCQKYKYGISCRYIYVSRKSLRTPIYYYEKQQGVEYLFEKSINMSINLIFERAGLSLEEKRVICQNINIPMENMDILLSNEEFQEIKKKLLNSKIFQGILYLKSERSWEIIKQYFYQEGFLEQDKIGIVDSGWMGSMQKNLQYLLERANINIELHGFYFGLFKSRKKLGKYYHSYYFQDIMDFSYGIFFNNNVFEILCSADHGMTVGYEEMDGIIVPKLKEYELNKIVNIQQEICLEFVKNMGVVRESSRKCIKKLVSIFMTKPSINEVKEYGNINFCDDITESYYHTLVGYINNTERYKYLLVVRVLAMILKNNRLKAKQKSYWYWGNIQTYSKRTRYIYRIDQIICQLLFWIKIHIGD